jgi:DNA-binding response OmpR family regulator
MFKILILEDDKFLRELIAQKLKKEGFLIIEAIDGEEGLKKIKEEKPNLILLDLILPGIDGFEVLEKIKGARESAKIPVIILSNLGQKDDVEKGMKLGATDYLIKAHFTPGEIIEKIKTVLQ